MNERKPITTDLRRWWELHCRTLATPELDEGLDVLCGAIDAVHANLEGENESLRRELDRALGEWDYWESTHVELPKDADGVPIHLGDVMEWCNGSFTVHELKLTEDGWQTWDSEHGYTVHADECIRHHLPDTWERIIKDAHDDGAHGKVFDLSEAVARCKALAGGAS